MVLASKCVIHDKLTESVSLCFSERILVFVNMKLFILLIVATAAFADKLQSNYLPPTSAGTAGGSSFLTAPSPSAHFGQASFTQAGLATSYAAPASGPVPSGLYNAPTRSYSGSYSSSSYSGTPVAILKFNNDNAGDGSYRFEYETENKISQQESGHLENAGTDHEANVVHGSYSYISPEGQTITVTYVADENGFRPTGEHLPTPPPIPQEILKSLAINAASTGTGQYPSGSNAGSYPAPSRQYLAPSGHVSSGYNY